MTAVGIVYVLHFDRPNSNNQRHYVGFSTDLPGRLWEHSRNVNGARVTKRTRSEGIGWTVAVIFHSATLKTEGRVHRLGAHTVCPLCGGHPWLFDGAEVFPDVEHRQRRGRRRNTAGPLT